MAEQEKQLTQKVLELKRYKVLDSSGLGLGVNFDGLHLRFVKDIPELEQVQLAQPNADMSKPWFPTVTMNYASVAEVWTFTGTKRVVSAAIRKDETGEVIIGVRHFCPIMLGQMQKHYPEGYWRSGCTQGFITNEMLVDMDDDEKRSYRFLDREDAFILAKEQGQIRNITTRSGGNALYSEDLY